MGAAGAKPSFVGATLVHNLVDFSIFTSLTAFQPFLPTVKLTDHTPPVSYLHRLVETMKS
jgi:hypothetical protein